MESILGRYRNVIVLLAVLLAQVIGLAVQVTKPSDAVTAGPNTSRDAKDGKGVRLIRVWAAGMVTPFERLIHGSGRGMGSLWSNYIDLRHTKDENKNLQETIDRLRLEQAALLEDARQGQRLAGLMHFEQNYIYSTKAAQVIGTSGSSQSRVIYLDKGSADGLTPDMAVIAEGGIVGKVRTVFSHSAQVLLINDQTSGAGVILETTRIRGILRGNAAGEPQVINILADPRIASGEPVLTAGGDQIFPRGLPVGVVEKVVRDPDRGSFINVIVKPAADLQRLDEVLVITSLGAHLSPQQQADLATSEELKGAEVAADAERKKAAAEMEERLPGLRDPGAEAQVAGEAKGDGGGATGVLVPVVPKPLPVKHPDRFSPGGSALGGAADAANAGGESNGGASASKPHVVKTQPVQPDDSSSAKPAAAKPSTGSPSADKPQTETTAPKTPDGGAR